ncbi:MAG: DUF2892 domain-containing protein [Thermoflavifilum sp.]|nr:DUF2892 domain-containing protein [Thermoflavifilum sp.]
MKRNVGLLDRLIRLLLAVVLGMLYVSHAVTGVWGLVLFIVGILLLFTAFVGFCPIYRLLGMRTCRLPK